MKALRAVWGVLAWAVAYAVKRGVQAVLGAFQRVLRRKKATLPPAPEGYRWRVARWK